MNLPNLSFKIFGSGAFIDQEGHDQCGLVNRALWLVGHEFLESHEFYMNISANCHSLN